MSDTTAPIGNDTAGASAGSGGNSMDVDSILAGIDGGGDSTPQSEAPKPTPEEMFEFKHQGKLVRGTRAQFLQWAQQGYNYPQRVEELKKSVEAQRQQWEQERQQYAQFRDVDAYARQNPQWWEHVTQSWQQIAKGQQPYEQQQQQQQPLDPRIAEIDARIRAMEEGVQAQRQQAEDAQLEQEIKQIQKQFPDIDLAQVDDTGKTLEFKILEFASEKGIQDFGTAFRAYTYDRMRESAEAKGREALAREKAKLEKAGFVSSYGKRTLGSSLGAQRPLKSQSYSDITNEILSELNGGGGR